MRAWYRGFTRNNELEIFATLHPVFSHGLQGRGEVRKWLWLRKPKSTYEAQSMEPS